MTKRKLKGIPHRRFRIEECYRSTTQKASSDLALAGNGFMVVEQDGFEGVSAVLFFGLETKVIARKLRKQVISETGKQNIGLMHKLRHHPEPIGWVT